MFSTQTVLPKLHSLIHIIRTMQSFLPNSALVQSVPDIRPYSCGTMNKHLLTSERELTADKSMNSTKFYFDEEMSFIEVTYRDIGEEIQEQ